MLRKFQNLPGPTPGERAISILGTRGIPARHGGFETFAERLALHLRQREWAVTVYCQAEGGVPPRLSTWKGISLKHLSVPGNGALSTVLFDAKATLDSMGQSGLCLTLGYNTAIFSALYRIKRSINLMNMDGIEWRRDKWGALARAWFYINEQLGCRLANHLIADHPAIADHLATRVSRQKITVIPYGADSIVDADARLLEPYGIQPSRYALVVARPEPENSVLEIVRAFSRRERGVKLLVLGHYDPKKNNYHRAVMAVASKDVHFVGAIYDGDIVNALRFYTALHVHGHTVGGTNPSLVEALGAGSPILAHNNRFNTWVTGPGARFFSNEDECAAHFDQLLVVPQRLDSMRSASRRRFEEAFTWDRILTAYESLFLTWLANRRRN